MDAHSSDVGKWLQVQSCVRVSGCPRCGAGRAEWRGGRGEAHPQQAGDRGEGRAERGGGGRRARAAAAAAERVHAALGCRAQLLHEGQGQRGRHVTLPPKETWNMTAAVAMTDVPQRKTQGMVQVCLSMLPVSLPLSASGHAARS